MYPAAGRLQALIGALLEAGGMTAGRETAEAEELWTAIEREAPRSHPPFERLWFAALLAERLSGPGAVVRVEPSSARAPSAVERLTPAFDRQHDWGDAPAVADFVGRSAELATIRDWVMQEHCRLVAVLGMGGIGKTSIAAKLAQEVAQAFQCVYWRGLRNAPPVTEWMAGTIAFLSGQTRVSPEGESQQLVVLLELLREQPTLLVLDNFETLLEPGVLEGRYRDGLAGYAAALQAIGETSHQSCVVITSREAPPDWTMIAGDSVRTLELSGLGTRDSQVLLARKQLSGDEVEWTDLIERYGGNSLALKVVGEASARSSAATSVRSLRNRRQARSLAASGGYSPSSSSAARRWSRTCFAL
jgi:hypothetical protein